MHQMQQRGGGRGEAKHPLVGKKCLGGGGRGGLLLLASRTPFIGGGGRGGKQAPPPSPCSRLGAVASRQERRMRKQAGRRGRERGWESGRKRKGGKKEKQAGRSERSRLLSGRERVAKRERSCCRCSGRGGASGVEPRHAPSSSVRPSVAWLALVPAPPLPARLGRQGKAAAAAPPVPPLRLGIPALMLDI